MLWSCGVPGEVRSARLEVLFVVSMSSVLSRFPGAARVVGPVSGKAGCGGGASPSAPASFASCGVVLLSVASGRELLLAGWAASGRAASAASPGRAGAVREPFVVAAGAVVVVVFEAEVVPGSVVAVSPGALCSKQKKSPSGGLVTRAQEKHVAASQPSKSQSKSWSCGVFSWQSEQGPVFTRGILDRHSCKKGVSDARRFPTLVARWCMA